MLSNKDVRIEGRNLIINGEKHPLDPAVDALIKRANTVQGKLSALDTRLDAIEALEKTASGNPISLTGVAQAYAMNLSMAIEPIQSGSGDPSPTNVRPISGLTSGEVQTTNGTDTNTATITFGQTVYGGSVNFKTGEVTVTHGYVEYDGSADEEWMALSSQSSTLYRMRISPPNNIKLPPDNNTPVNAISNQYLVLEARGPYTAHTGLSVQSNGEYLAVYDANYNQSDSVSAWKAHLASEPLTVCYELATPTTLTLTPAELELLKGANTISGNGVTINIGYIGR